MNYYQKAIESNEVIDFFRGNGKYFSKDIDREGIHDFSFTSYNIMGYGNEFGEYQLYEKLEDDLIKYLDVPNFELKDLIIILGIIWVYCIFRKEDNIFKTDWVISTELKNEIQSRIQLFTNPNEDVSEMNRIISSLKNRFDISF